MKMKRYLSLLLAGTLALALTACGGSAKTDPGTSDQPSTSDENWAPKENVTMIVSYKAGSGTDNLSLIHISWPCPHSQNRVCPAGENCSAVGWERGFQVDP